MRTVKPMTPEEAETFQRLIDDTCEKIMQTAKGPDRMSILEAIVGATIMSTYCAEHQEGVLNIMCRAIRDRMRTMQGVHRERISKKAH